MAECFCAGLSNGEPVWALDMLIVVLCELFLNNVDHNLVKLVLLDVFFAFETGLF